MGRAIVDALLRDNIKCYGFDIARDGLKEMEGNLGSAFVGMKVDLTKAE